jgi:hypothetical protein
MTLPSNAILKDFKQPKPPVEAFGWVHSLIDPMQMPPAVHNHQPEGLTSISRGLRSAERDDPPGRSPLIQRPRRGRSRAAKLRSAGIPSGCIPVLRPVRGGRFAHPPANGWHGFAAQTALFRRGIVHRTEDAYLVRRIPTGFRTQPEGLISISRGLRSAERDDTPGSAAHPQRPRRGRSSAAKLHPAGIPSGCVSVLRPVRGCRSAQPPANGWHGFAVRERQIPVRILRWSAN